MSDAVKMPDDVRDAFRKLHECVQQYLAKDASLADPEKKLEALPATPQQIARHVEDTEEFHNLSTELLKAAGEQHEDFSEEAMERLEKALAQGEQSARAEGPTNTGDSDFENTASAQAVDAEDSAARDEVESGEAELEEYAYFLKESLRRFGATITQRSQGRRQRRTGGASGSEPLRCTLSHRSFTGATSHVRQCPAPLRFCRRGISFR